MAKKHTKTKSKKKPKHKQTVDFKNCSRMCTLLCTIAINYTAHNSSDNLPSYPPDNQMLSPRGEGMQGGHVRRNGLQRWHK